jgi:hypothetical protein
LIETFALHQQGLIALAKKALLLIRCVTGMDNRQALRTAKLLQTLIRE